MAEKEPEAVLFFDACMPEMQECFPGCQDNTAVLCKHRFNFNPLIIYGNGKIPGFPDFRVVLYFFRLIRKKEVQAARSVKYFLVTRDKKFLKSVRKQSQTKKNAHFTFDLKRKCISCNSITIHICTVNGIKSKAVNVQKAINIQRKTIERLNRFFEK